MRIVILLGVLLMSSVVSACPDYLQGEYRKLHSKKMIDLCEVVKDKKAILVVNTASHCGFTSQFEGLEALNQKYQDKGLVVIGFASDDFKQEDADEEKAADICFVNFGVKFTMQINFSWNWQKNRESLSGISINIYWMLMASL
jgi:glutathione peroxidase